MLIFCDFLQVFVFTTNHYLNWFEICVNRPQQAHDIKMTSYFRRIDVITSHRRQYDVILMLCACWDGGARLTSELGASH